jgi:hypothetical protein
MPADNQTDPNKPADPVEVELPGGVKVRMAQADADTYRAAARKKQDHADELARAAGAARAEKEAAEATAKRAAEDAAALKLAKDGEIGKVRELMQAEGNAKLAKIGQTVIAAELRAAVAAKAPGLDATALADIVALVTPRARFDADRVAGEYLDEAGRPFQVDGKPAGADALVADFLSKRPHLTPTKSPGRTATSSTEAGGKASGTGPAISAKAAEAMGAVALARHFQAGGTILPG